jgi:hypothetical protein
MIRLNHKGIRGAMLRAPGDMEGGDVDNKLDGLIH